MRSLMRLQMRWFGVDLLASVELAAMYASLSARLSLEAAISTWRYSERNSRRNGLFTRDIWRWWGRQRMSRTDRQNFHRCHHAFRNKGLPPFGCRRRSNWSRIAIPGHATRWWNANCIDFFRIAIELIYVFCFFGAANSAVQVWWDGTA